MAETEKPPEKPEPKPEPRPLPKPDPGQPAKGAVDKRDREKKRESRLSKRITTLSELAGRLPQRAWFGKTKTFTWCE